jgi:nitrite reductase (NADH) large subunit
MADAMEVCGCNGVPKGAIVRAIKEKGRFTLEDVRKHTKASSSCGSCTGLVEQLLASTVGGAYQPQEAKLKPLCGCTDHTHEEVRKAIREHRLLSISAAIKFLEGGRRNGAPAAARRSTTI